MSGRILNPQGFIIFFQSLNLICEQVVAKDVSLIIRSVKQAELSRVLKVHVCSFNFISNMSQAQAQAHQQTKLQVQTWFIYLSSKLKLIHELLD